MLTSEPTDPVTVDLSGGLQAGVTPTSVTFLPTNWNVPVSITVAAIDDPVDEPTDTPARSTFVVSSLDANYGVAALAPVDLTITDNDTPAVIVAQTDTGNAVVEGGATDQLQFGSARSRRMT